MAKSKKKVVKKPAKAKTPAKKKAAPKKKTPAKKKAVKKIVNPHIGKRYFAIEVGGYGGEIVAGKASEEFVKYWLNPERKDRLADHIMAMHRKAAYGIEDEEDEDNQEFDSDSPEVLPGIGDVEYWNLDDFEHDTWVSSDYAGFTVGEIELNPQAVYKDGALDWDDKYCNKKNFDWGQDKFTPKGKEQEVTLDRVVYSRELFIEDKPDDILAYSEAVPAIMVYDSQKGVFGRLIVETNGEDFDPKKFAYTVCENTMSNSITGFYYDKKQLSLDMDILSTWGKGFCAAVGYLPKIDTEYNHDLNMIEGWQNLEESE